MDAEDSEPKYNHCSGYFMKRTIPIEQDSNMQKWIDEDDGDLERYRESTALSAIEEVGAIVFYGGGFMQVLHKLSDGSVLCAKRAMDVEGKAVNTVHRYRGDLVVQIQNPVAIRRVIVQCIVKWDDHVHGCGYVVLDRLKL